VSVDDSGAAADTVSRFDADDLLDLSLIDTDRRADGDQGFVLVEAFSGHRGEVTVTYDENMGWNLLQADVDGDGVGDFGFTFTDGDGGDYSDGGNLLL
jgi:hypothetical protein